LVVAFNVTRFKTGVRDWEQFAEAVDNVHRRRGVKRKPDERIYNPRNGRNCNFVAKSLTTYPFGRPVTNFSAFRWFPRLFTLDLPFFFPSKMEKGFTRRVHFSLLRMIMVMQFDASFGNTCVFSIFSMSEARNINYSTVVRDIN